MGGKHRGAYLRRVRAPMSCGMGESMQGRADMSSCCRVVRRDKVLGTTPVMDRRAFKFNVLQSVRHGTGRVDAGGQ
jgi:hypothetical protein